MEDFEQEIRTIFLQETEKSLQDLESLFLELERSSDLENAGELINKVFRAVHNIKGSAGAVGFSQLVDVTHHLESFLLSLTGKAHALKESTFNFLLLSVDLLQSYVITLRKNPDAVLDFSKILDGIQSEQNGISDISTRENGQDVGLKLRIASDKDLSVKNDHSDHSVRISLEKLDKLINNVGELVILESALFHNKSLVQSSFLQNIIVELNKVSRTIQDVSMSLRMVPLQTTFQKLHRVIRTTAQSVGKSVKLEILGGETEIDKLILEQLNDPLVHLVRNAVDHGLESSEARISSGKPEAGSIRMSAAQRSDKIIIEVSDDGCGLHPEKIRRKAIEKRLISESQILSDDEVYQLIFHPGISTRDDVTDISGRGIGMSVVKTNIESLQGKIEILTTKGAGTTFRISLPVSLSIQDSLIISEHGERYVIPISQIIESINLDKIQIKSLFNRGEMISLRGKNLPLYRLSKLLHLSETSSKDHESVIIIAYDHEQKSVGILVESVIGQQKIVTKCLGTELKNHSFFCGGTVLGDGRPALILDLAELVSSKYKPLSPQQGIQREVSNLSKTGS